MSKKPSGSDANLHTPSARNFIMQLISGAGAGAITKTCIAPLERIKILLQIQGMRIAEGAIDQPKYSGMMDCGRYVVREEGMAALWRGNGANVARVVPVYALKFGFNDSFKEMVAGADALKHGYRLSFSQLIQAGTLAGLFQQLITYPLEVVRTRLTMGPKLGIAYKGMLDCATQTIKSEGIPGLYKGLAPTLMSGSPYVGIQMTAYEMLSRMSPQLDYFQDEAVRSAVAADGTPQPASLAFKLCAGAVAGLLAQSITYPGDTIRRRMQLNGAGGKARQYRTSWDCTMQIYRQEGIPGFFRGVGTNVVRCIPGAAIQFAAYETLKQLLVV